MLAATLARNVYTGNGATSLYGWGPWLANLATDLHVAVLSNASPQVLTNLVLNTDYTIQSPATQLGNSNGGNIILSPTGFLAASAGNLPNGWNLIIRRSITFYQPGVLGNQEGSQAGQIESMIDYLAMQTQQNQDAIAHTIQTPLDDAAAPAQNLPVASLRANTVLGFNATGDPINVAGALPAVPVTGFWSGMLALTTAALSRASLGFGGAGGTVQTANIDPAGLGSAAYAAGSVITAALANLAVTAVKIANATITNVQIAAATILPSNLDPSVASSIGAVPTGGMVPFGGTAAPTGYLICDGSSVLRATYAGLFGVIGTAYGSVDGTHFTLPDLRNYYPRGVTGIGPDIPGLVTAASTDNSPTHQHNVNAGGVSWKGSSTGDQGPFSNFSDLVSGGGHAVVVPKNVGVNYIIKT